MKKSLIFLLIILTACKTKPVGEVKLELLNNEVYFVGQVDDQHSFKYKNLSEKELSSNLLTYKISNTTDKKILFIIDKDKLLPTNNKQNKDTGYVKILISDSNKTIPYNAPIIDFSNEKILQAMIFGLNVHNYQDSLKINKYERVGIKNRMLIDDVDKYVKNSFILYPQESRTFRVTLNLPIIDEMRPELAQVSPVSYPELKEGQNFQLYYNCTAKALKEILPDYLIKDIEENKTEIFDGTLTSNPVPLKLKK